MLGSSALLLNKLQPCMAIMLGACGVHAARAVPRLCCFHVKAHWYWHYAAGLQKAGPTLTGHSLVMQISRVVPARPSSGSWGRLAT